jgi:hypothetical protein
MVNRTAIVTGSSVSHTTNRFDPHQGNAPI